MNARPSLRHDLPILERYEVDPESGCWLWLGNINTGYGRCRIGKRLVMAHRVFYEHHIGTVPSGQELDHVCRRRACVNPAHLEPVSRAENVRRGAATKLTEADVRAIRTVVDALCQQYGIRPRTLAAIGERTIWKEV